MTWGLLLTILLTMGSLCSAETPQGEELRPLIREAWIHDPPLARKLLPPTDPFEKTRRGAMIDVTITHMEVGPSKYGRFHQVGDVTDTVGPKMNAFPNETNRHVGPPITYWPVTVEINTTYIKLVQDGEGRIGLLNWKEDGHIVETGGHQCYAFKEKDGR
jgi:hypothetical protein